MFDESAEMPQQPEAIDISSSEYRQEINSKIDTLNSFYQEQMKTGKNDSFASKQEQLVQGLLTQASQLKQALENGSDEDVVSLYGHLIDQVAIKLPMQREMQGQAIEVQRKALATLKEYLARNPDSRQAARELFMLYHHGALVDQGVLAAMYERAYSAIAKKQPIPPPPAEYNNQFIKSELAGKPYLEKAIGLTIGQDSFSLDSDQDIELLMQQETPSNESMQLLEDAANWLRRIAHYQKKEGKNFQYYFTKAEIIYKKLQQVRGEETSSSLENMYEQFGIKKAA